MVGDDRHRWGFYDALRHQHRSLRFTALLMRLVESAHAWIKREPVKTR
jgi:hypothetical protein